MDARPPQLPPLYVPYAAPAIESEPPEQTAPKRPLPVARVKKIMKEHRDGRFAEEAVVAMTVATELFVGKLTQMVCEQGPFEDPNTMEYRHVAKCVHSQSKLDFLQEYVPMTVNVGSLVAQAKDTLRNGENSNAHKRSCRWVGDSVTAAAADCHSMTRVGREWD